MVDLVVGGEESVITIGVGGTEGLQVIRELGRHQTGRGQDQWDSSQLEIQGISSWLLELNLYHHEKLPIRVCASYYGLEPLQLNLYRSAPTTLAPAGTRPREDILSRDIFRKPGAGMK